MTEIIDIHTRQPRPVPDLTKHDPLREVLEGVVIPPDTPTPTPGTAPSTRVTRERVRRAVGVTLHVARHERTRTAAGAVVRHGAYVAGGAGILARRAWDGRTAARYERLLRIAEAAGQHETALEWEERGRAYRAARHQRRMDLLASPQRIAKGMVVGTATAAGSLVGLGTLLAVAEHNPALVIAPVMFTIDVVRTLVWLGSVVWGPAVWLGPWLLLLAVWNTGRKGQAAPQWSLPAAQRSGTSRRSP